MKRLIEFHALPNIGTSRSEYKSVKEWISSNRFTNICEMSGGVFLSAYDFEEILSAISNDFLRFSCSCIESMELSGLERESSPATAWPLLKSYYSGFFGAHAVLNSVGLGEIFLNASSIQILMDFAELTDAQVPQISPGAFVYKVIDSDSDTGLLILQGVTGQGVHDGFWKRLCGHFSEMLDSYVQSGAPNSAEIVDEVDRIQNLVRNSHHRGMWLSNTRNEINYQHLYDCWLPNTRRSRSRELSFESVYDSSIAWRSLDGELAELERFLRVSRCFSSLCSEMVNYYVGAHGGNSPIARRWSRLKSLLKC